uniref:Serpin domain-containing protein n=1 Tax=Panagrolaimus davidi TaxID=227884 RepID=A0A914PHV5_9BILA
MYIVLPNEKNGLQKIVENLKPENFYQWTKRSRNPYVFVRVPVMNISNEFQLKENLQKLGMKDAFEEDICNLTGMIKEPSKLDKIIHKTVMKTDEYGTEASAATSIYDLRCGGRIERFKADHPFLFFITTNNPKDFKPINI